MEVEEEIELEIEKGKWKMIISIGKHKNSDSRIVFFKNPDYVLWVLCQINLKNDLKKLQNNFINLMKIFNSKPLIKSCKCTKPATCTYFLYDYKSNDVYVDILGWFCDDCYPSDWILPPSGYFVEIKNYIEIPDKILDRGGTVKNCVQIIQEIAFAKGMKHPFKHDIINFFKENNCTQEN